MRESTRKGLRWHVRNLLNCLDFAGGGYDPRTGNRGPFVGKVEHEKQREKERYFEQHRHLL